MPRYRRTGSLASTQSAAGEVMRRRALRAVALGFHVFPVRAGDKTPAVPKNTSWDDLATRDVAQVNAWWGKGAAHNIGVSTGKSGLLVVDLDHACGSKPPAKWEGVTSGREVLERLAGEAGEQFPADTYTVRTWSGGMHLYFRAPEDLQLRNTAGTLGFCVDTRGLGGYVVGAGSVRQGHVYTVTNRVPIAPLPDWLCEALAPKVPTPRASSPTLVRGNSRAKRYLAAIVEGETAKVVAGTRGSRNHTLFIAALKLGSLVGAGELGELFAQEALLAAAARHFGVDDFTETEARKTIASGLRMGKQSPRHIRRQDRAART